ncbi:ligand-binding sensor domain-containing protein [Paraclostridium bifermentans]|uniref:ligand-binding sensor domain-containing protein n=1 Tax=Paraclostridium bifermentans TaxID=1490 RepID=UPI00359C69E4
MIKTRYFKIVIFVLFIFISVTNISNAQKSINFRNLTIEDGLSQGTVQAMIQDKEGRIWIGTNDGLNVYNGYEFKLYTQQKDEEEGIANNYITDIAQDNSGNVWVATIGGLSKINIKTDKITNYYKCNKHGNLSHNNVYDILISSDGKVLVSTSDGVDMYNEKEDRFSSILKDVSIFKSIHAYELEEDNDKNLWVGTKKGLYKIYRDEGKVESFLTEESHGKDINIYDLYLDGKDNLWIGTESDGLYGLNIKNNKLRKYDITSEDKDDIVIRDLLLDSKKNLWVASDVGLLKYDEKEDEFKVYQSCEYDNNGLIDNVIYSIMEDQSGLIWLGTYSGISIFDPSKNIEYYKHSNNPNNDISISENMVSGIHKDKDGLVWVGTNSRGINILDRENEKTYYITTENGLSSDTVYDVTGNGDVIAISTNNGLNVINKKDRKLKIYNEENGLKNSDIRSAFIDDNNYIWLGTTEGVFIVNIETDDILDLSKVEDKLCIKDKLVGSIFKDSKGNYWIGYFLDGGLVKYNPETDESKVYKMNNKNKNSLSSNSVRSIDEDKKGNLWIGTNYGLNKFNPDKEEFIRYTKEDGLPNNTIYGVIVDGKGHIWVSTNYGISKFEPSKNEFTNFDIVDGIQGREFNAKSYHLGYDNEIFFGGTNGFNSFRCEELKKEKYYVDLVIDNIYVNDRRYKDINKADFNYDENDIVIEMFLPYYKNIRDTKYYYKLEGIDKEFKEAKSNKINLVNLQPGNYKLKLKASNNNVAISQQKTIYFNIKPPFWKSKVAMILYTLIAILCLLYYDSKVKILDKMVNKRTRALTNEIEKNEELFVKVLNLEKQKNSYFVNLSHELRTPLNVISSTEQLISSMINKKGISKESLNYHMTVIKKNSERLLELITNLMDIEKIEHGKYIIEKTEQDIVEVIEDEAIRLKNHVECEGIELIIDPEIEEKIVSFDKKEIKRCIENLIGNAVKFTPSGGKIEVVIKDLGDSVLISVEDNGIGIDEKNQKVIFDRFKQAVGANEQIQNSSGLGLTITRDIVKLHGGEITLESEIGKGSKFIIILPVE